MQGVPDMSDIWYRGYCIRLNDCNIDPRCDYVFAHDDYDGAEDSRDQRSGFGRTVEDCKKEIDQIEAVLEEERQQEISDNSQFGVGA